MERTYIEELEKKSGQEVRLQGWAQAVRRHSGVQFLVVRDRSGTVQCVVDKQNEEAWKAAAALAEESVVEVLGIVKEEPQAPGGHEVQVAGLSVLSRAAAELPIPVVEKGGQEVEQSLRLDYRWLDLRNPKRLLIFKVWTLLEEGFADFCRQRGFLEIHSPKLMSVPSESGAELFEVGYFGKKAYLSQSPQFYKQMAMAAGFERIFEIGPVFRAEPSFTTRHATEFTGFDVEMSFIESHQDIIEFWQELVVAMLTAIKERYGEEIREVYGRELAVPALPFPQLTMKEAKALLAERGVASEKAGDLSPEEERQLSALVSERYGHEFVFVTEYPEDVRPFYHMRLEGDPSLTRSFDLLWNGIEITTGAQREHRYEVLCEQALGKGLSLEPIRHYLDFFKWGCPPHGGMGIGPVRMMMKIFDTENIREVTYLHRGVNRLTP